MSGKLALVLLLCFVAICHTQAPECPGERTSDKKELTVRAFNLKRDGKIPEAKACIEQILHHDPEYALGWLNLGILSIDNVGLAYLCFHQAVSIAPEMSLAKIWLGNTLKIMGEWPRAEEQLLHALQLGGHEHLSYFHLGDVYKAQRRLDEALSSYQSSLQYHDNADVWNAMGNVFQDVEDHIAAIAAYTRAVQLNPNHFAAYHNMANSYTMDEQVEDALVNYEHALRINPQHHMAFAHWLYYRMFACLWDERDALVARMREITRAEIAANVPQVSLQAFQAMALPIPRHELREVMRKHASEIAERVAVFQQQMLAPEHRTDDVAAQAAIIRVGYVSSAAFNNHVRAHLVQKMFAFQDRTRIESFCYALSPDDSSPERERTASTCSHFRDVSELSHLDTAKVIRNDRLDVLVDMNGHTQGARMEVFALHPAPVQLSMVAFAATTGASYIDYFVGDKISTPPPFQHAFIEKLIVMPHSYQLNSIKHSEKALTRSSPEVPSRDSLGFTDNDVVLCSFNHLYKIDPDIWQLWMRVLRAVPNAKLWLLQYPTAAEAALRSEAQRAGMDDTTRLRFSPMFPQSQRSLHFARSVQCDLFLDTPLYNAHTTATDALWAGIPLITYPGAVMAARVAASLVTAAGLPELVVQSLQHYEQLAVQLASSPESLRALRARLEETRHTSAVFDTELWTRHHQRVLEMCVDLSSHGRSKQHIVVAG
eukprot:TRINITY_DN7901_c0_g1_i1.p1 TRINITY_DN7901_c0_g1~~TRINITY_DN7901_c0_g1_i1.p1  ORF type:complete len:712 (-),score=167.76 TRINITY_DN7901_c0_g1_i1:45-2180(-)